MQLFAVRWSTENYVFLTIYFIIFSLLPPFLFSVVCFSQRRSVQIKNLFWEGWFAHTKKIDPFPDSLWKLKMYPFHVDIWTTPPPFIRPKKYLQSMHCGYSKLASQGAWTEAKDSKSIWSFLTEKMSQNHKKKSA